MQFSHDDFLAGTALASKFSTVKYFNATHLPTNVISLDKSIGLNPEVMEVADSLYSVAKAQTAIQTAKYLSAVKAGDASGKAEAVQNLISNPLCLFTAALEANAKLPPRYQVQPATCLFIANDMDVTAPLNEVQRGLVVPKSKGGFRVLVDPGIILRTAGVTAIRLLTPYVKLRPWQYTRKGTYCTIRAIRETINKSLSSAKPSIYAARLDITSFFPSHDPEWLVNELPLPKEVVEHVVIGRHFEVKVAEANAAKTILATYSLSYEHFNDLARQGLPQGLATSSLIAMMTIARLKWPATSGVAMFNLADDFFLLAQTEKDLSEAIEKLQGAVAKLPGGQFELNLKQVGSLSKGIDFLGHTLRITESGLRVSPSHASMEIIMSKLDKLEEEIYSKTGKPTKNPERAVELGARYVALVRGWRAAHQACDDLETRWCAEFIAHMDEILAALGVTLQQAKAGCKPWMTYKHIVS
ncbi:MAG: reverse transcriptase domain-containing protein [Beijerinckiaceae bacterium]